MRCPTVFDYRWYQDIFISRVMLWKDCLLLNIDDKEQEELFKILESNNSSDSLEDDFSSLSDSCYQFANDSSDSPNIKIG